MIDQNSKSLDVFGVKPFADSIKTVTEGAVEGAGAFLSRICLPAAEEFGFLLRDRVSNWRSSNAVRVLQLAEKKLKKRNLQQEVHAHPRLVMSALEQGSWAEQDDIQDMWAGLLSSACTADGSDDSNLIFMNVLRQLTSAEVAILNHACTSSQKYVSCGGWIYAREFLVTLEQLQEITRIHDVHRLDRELDHLRSLELIAHGFSADSTAADITPTAFGLHMYIRAEGYLGSPVEFFGAQPMTDEEALDQTIDMPGPADILDHISRVPLLSQADVSKQYLGREVEWPGTLQGASRSNNGLISVAISSVQRSGSTVCGEVAVKDCPALPDMMSEEPVMVRGKIQAVGTFTVTLEAMQLERRTSDQQSPESCT
ncbi:MAG: hypothetical protein HN341_01355 [Verrucomicrobia bacterium]|jgi:hypothetical protein|nr:hypothetical protein [Verrucomicrobiota bacterium]